MITRKVTTADLIGIDDQATKNQVTITDTDVTFSGPLLLPDGATAAPSLSFSGDTGAGLLRTASGDLQITGVATELQIIRTDNDSNTIFSIGNDTLNTFDFSRDKNTGALSLQGSQTGNNDIILAPTSGNIGIGSASAGVKLFIDQDADAISLGIDSEATTKPCIQMDVSTSDVGFFNFVASADADATSAISTLTTSGAVTHHIQCEINGTTFWIAGSTTDPS